MDVPRNRHSCICWLAAPFGVRLLVLGVGGCLGNALNQYFNDGIHHMGDYGRQADGHGIIGYGIGEGHTCSHRVYPDDPIF